MNPSAPASRMPDDPRRSLLRSLTYGVYLVGTRAEVSEIHVFTATWLSQASMQPPLVMLGCRKDGTSDRHILETRVFTVNLLADGQKDLAAKFFRCPPAADGRFGDVPFRVAENGCPAFAQTLGTLECEVVASVDEGDHRVYVARVTSAVRHNEGNPLALSQTGWTYGG